MQVKYRVFEHATSFSLKSFVKFFASLLYDLASVTIILPEVIT